MRNNFEAVVILQHQTCLLKIFSFFICIFPTDDLQAKTQVKNQFQAKLQKRTFKLRLFGKLVAISEVNRIIFLLSARPVLIPPCRSLT